MQRETKKDKRPKNSHLSNFELFFLLEHSTKNETKAMIKSKYHFVRKAILAFSK